MVSRRLEDIVNEFIDEQDGQTVHNFRRYLGFGIRAVRQLHMEFTGFPTFEMLEIDQNTSTVTIPSDCIRVLKVAEVNPDNTLKPLKIKDGIVLNTDDSEGYGDYYGSYVGHYFGANGVSGAGYKIDLGSEKIKVTTEVTSDCLYVEYLADLKKIDGKHLIHPYNCEAILAYIRFANIRSNPNANMNDRLFAERLWEKERKLSLKMNRSMTIQEMYDSYRLTYTGAPRG